MVTLIIRQLNRRSTKRELERHLQLLLRKSPPESQVEEKCFCRNPVIKTDTASVQTFGK